MRPPRWGCQHKNHPPTRHVVALRHGKELNRDVFRTGNLQYRRDLVAIKYKVCICEILHDPDLVFLSDGNQALIEVDFDTLCCRVTREVDDEQFGFGPTIGNGCFKLAEKVDVRC